MSPPPLSNRLADLAERAGEEARTYKRASLEAHAAYLRAGAILAEARTEARRGEWGVFLARAGIEARTARNMMTLAAAGFTGETLHRSGGVKAALAALRETSETGEKPETVSASADPPARETASDIEPEPWRTMNPDDALRWLAHAAVPPLPAFGARAYALRERGLKWIEIAHALDYRPDITPRRRRMLAMRLAVRSYARHHKFPWPLPRPEPRRDEP